MRCPRVRDRVDEGSERIRFSSAILPPYARRSKSLEVLIPILYLKGVSTGDFDEALIALLGNDAGGQSARLSDEAHSFSDCPTFAKKLILTKRIRWIADSTGSPSFNHARFIWDRLHKGPPTLAYTWQHRNH